MNAGKKVVDTTRQVDVPLLYGHTVLRVEVISCTFLIPFKLALYEAKWAPLGSTNPGILGDPQILKIV
jgi:hypothetical protein